MLVVGVTVGLSVAAVVTVRRRVARETLKAHQEVAGALVAVVAGVYAVLLAFVVVIVWEQFGEAEANAEHEAAAVGLTYRDALAIGDRGVELRMSLTRYADSVVHSEWPRMEDKHEESRETDAALNAVWFSYRRLAARTGPDTAFYEQGLERLHDAVELRRERVHASGSQLPEPLWLVLVVGAVITLGFTAFFAVEGLGAHVAMVGALAATIGLVLLLILSLDLPYTGDIGVSPSAMEDALQEFAHSG